MAALPVGDAWQRGTEEDLTVIHDCLCVNCGSGTAVTSLLPTKVPSFREIILTHLVCEDCGFKSADINFGGEIQLQGERIVVTIATADDLNRQVIKSDSCTVIIPIMSLEIPPGTQRGTLSTIEGFLKRAAENLESQQPDRLQLGDLDNFYRCKATIEKLLLYANGGVAVDGDNEDDEEQVADEDNGADKGPVSVFPFEIILDDPAGNSFVENPLAPAPDPQIQSTHYWRTPNQDMALGLQPSQQAVEEGRIDDSNPQHKNVVNAAPRVHTLTTDPNLNLGRQEVLKFPTTCAHCYRPAETDMCVTDIPHFKEVIIMSLVCDNCGYRSNEIKGGGAIPKYGCKMTLTAKSPDDLAREVLKSDTAGLEIPEIELELDDGGLDGVYTTVEGLLQKVKTRLRDANPFGTGDASKQHHTSNDGGAFSEPLPTHVKYQQFLEKLESMSQGLMLPFTLVISDPLANSFIGPIPADAMALSLQAEKDGNNSCYEAYVDERLHVEEYERTFDQNEMLGLNDIKTEQYTNSVNAGEYNGTDQVADLPDRIQYMRARGPDHPHAVAMAPVENDTTVMGPSSLQFAVPSMGQRGKLVEREVTNPSEKSVLNKFVRDCEFKDTGFVASAEYTGSREGRVFKNGVQGVGYYLDRPLLEEWNKQV
jgi:zinc finger protein